MSFTLRYRPFLSVRVLDRDSGKPLPGFRFAPTPSCVKTLADRRLVFRPAGGGFGLLWKANPEAVDPVAARINAMVQFTFVMWPPETELFRTFEPDLTATSGPRLHLHNLTPGGNVRSREDLTGGSFVQARDAVRVVPTAFDVTLGAEEIHGATTCRVSPGVTPADPVLEVPLAAAPGVQQIPIRIDLAHHPTGPYVVQTDAPAAVPRTMYVSDEVARTTALAVVTLHWDRGQDTVPSGGIQYHIRFRRR